MEGAPDRDFDRDGMPNINEFLAGTGPTNKASVLAFLGVIRNAGGSFQLQWAGGEDAAQCLEYCTNIMSSGVQWKPIYTNQPPTSRTNSFTDTDATNRVRFYRINIL